MLTVESLVTLMYAVAAIINSKPLTRFSDDPKDPTDSKDLYVWKRWRQLQYLADQANKGILGDITRASEMVSQEEPSRCLIGGLHTTSFHGSLP